MIECMMQNKWVFNFIIAENILIPLAIKEEEYTTIVPLRDYQRLLVEYEY